MGVATPGQARVDRDSFVFALPRASVCASVALQGPLAVALFAAKTAAKPVQALHMLSGHTLSAYVGHGWSQKRMGERW